LPPLNQILKKSWPNKTERLLIENLYSPFVPLSDAHHLDGRKAGFWAKRSFMAQSD
jgi:hypothetical protein